MNDHRRGEQRVEAGLQDERTTLAWDRTALTLIGSGALFLRVGGAPYHELRHIPGLIVMVLGTALLLSNTRRYRRGQAELGPRFPPSAPWLPRLLGVVVAVFSVASLGLVIFGG